MKSLKRILLSICALFALVSTTGVYALWHYAGNPADSVQTTISVGIGLPNYEEEHLDYQGLLTALIDGTDENGNPIKHDGEQVGLNNPNSFLNKTIKARVEGADSLGGGKIEGGRNTVGSMAKLFEDEFEAYGADVANLRFLFYFPDGANSTTLKVYTWSTVDGDLPLSISGKKVTTSDVEMGNWRTGSLFNYDYHPESVPTKTVWVYPIFETTITKGADGVWRQGDSVSGYAQACFYTENRNNAVFSTMHGSKLLSIYPPSFTTKEPVV